MALITSDCGAMHTSRIKWLWCALALDLIEPQSVVIRATPQEGGLYLLHGLSEVDQRILLSLVDVENPPSESPADRSED